MHLGIAESVQPDQMTQSLPQLVLAHVSQYRRQWTHALWALVGVWVSAAIFPDAFTELLDSIDGQMPAPPWDWLLYLEAGERAGTDRLYAAASDMGVCHVCVFRYSPVMAYAFALMAPVGIDAWRLSHFAVLPLLGWWFPLVLLAWPFWWDVQSGNVMTFVLVSGIWAARGSPIGTWSYLTLTLLVPRPLMFPLAAWILWKRPDWRRRFAVLFVVHAAAVMASGLAVDWIEVLLKPNPDIDRHLNVSPSAWLGPIWPLIGLPLGLWFWLRGNLAMSSLAASPYLLPYYLLIAFLTQPSDASSPHRVESDVSRAPT